MVGKLFVSRRDRREIITGIGTLLSWQIKHDQLNNFNRSCTHSINYYEIFNFLYLFLAIFSKLDQFCIAHATCRFLPRICKEALSEVTFGEQMLLFSYVIYTSRNVCSAIPSLIFHPVNPLRNTRAKEQNARFASISALNSSVMLYCDSDNRLGNIRWLNDLHE